MGGQKADKKIIEKGITGTIDMNCEYFHHDTNVVFQYIALDKGYNIGAVHWELCSWQH